MTDHTDPVEAVLLEATAAHEADACVRTALRQVAQHFDTHHAALRLDFVALSIVIHVDGHPIFVTLASDDARHRLLMADYLSDPPTPKG